MPAQQTQNISNLYSLIPFIVIMALVTRRMIRGQTMRLHSLWIRPAIIVALAVFVIVAAPPSKFLEIASLLVTTAIGAFIGWHQGKMMTISIEPDSRLLNVKASPLAVIAFMTFITVRILFRPYLMAQATAWHINLGVVSDGFILLIAGYYLAQTVEVFIRAKAMLTMPTNA